MRFTLSSTFLSAMTRRCVHTNNTLKPDTAVVKNNLKDTYGREHTYLRISITERCNLRCQYCMPSEGVNLTKKSNLLTTDELLKLARIFVQEGVKKIRLTGGEPTVNKDLPFIIENLKEIPGLETIAMTTNGITLVKHLEKLQKAGLSRINIAVDTLKPERFEQITKRKGLSRVMAAIDLALELGYKPVKLNTLLMRGVNDDEILDFIELTRNKDINVRFIEFMPFDGNKWSRDKIVSFADVRNTILKEYPNFQQSNTNDHNTTSKPHTIPGFKGQIGFITSMTQHFCGSCSRLRLLADGSLKVCLLGSAEISLRDALRNGCSNDDLVAMIKASVLRKKKQHADKMKMEFVRREYSTLSHVNSDGKAQMVNVNDKKPTLRIAKARGVVHIGPQITKLILENQMKKGDVLSVGKLAGIMGAKNTSKLIPLCHDIQLSYINVELHVEPEEFQVVIESEVKCTGKTGVEMESLTAVSIAALTVYDMCKSVSKNIVISDIRLIMKEGGKSDFHATQTDNLKILTNKTSAS